MAGTAKLPAGAVSLPRWRSRKTVRAGRFVRFGDAGQPLAVVCDPGDGAPEVTVEAPAGTFARGRPIAGDYIMVMEPDGIVTWSPRKVFEDAYMRLAP